jgi:hypothetical protein
VLLHAPDPRLIVVPISGSADAGKFRQGLWPLIDFKTDDFCPVLQTSLDLRAQFGQCFLARGTPGAQGKWVFVRIEFDAVKALVEWKCFSRTTYSPGPNGGPPSRVSRSAQPWPTIGR